MCPQLQADLSCTQECQSDAQCADNLKCCQAGCATICHLPDGNPGAPRAGRGRAPCAGGGRAPGSGQGDAPAAPRDPCRVETDGTRSAVRSLSGPRAGDKGVAEAQRGSGGREVPPPLAGFHSPVRDGFPGKHRLEGVSGGQGTRFAVSSAAAWSRGEARGRRVGWVPTPGALRPLGVPPLGRPPALAEGLGAPGLARLPWLPLSRRKDTLQN